ncbi:endonuclease/exonuclease/phosphatase family protein [Parabacteroides sp. AM58-2XD]|nr:endonuclease/exonuclease/phosphatase family protein [Parabacteroides sp. AM58-2XD]
MDFLVTHLNPHDRLKRKKEADNIIDYINKNQLTNCLLMGDMNAHSPFDASWTDEHLKNYAVISTFMAASLHDICYMFTPDNQRYSYPTRILTSSPKGEALRRQQERIDFIFVTDNLRPDCVDAQIYNGPDNDYLSDHYPIGISMFIPKE